MEKDADGFYTPGAFMNSPRPSQLDKLSPQAPAPSANATPAVVAAAPNTNDKSPGPGVYAVQVTQNPPTYNRAVGPNSELITSTFEVTVSPRA